MDRNKMIMIGLMIALQGYSWYLDSADDNSEGGSSITPKELTRLDSIFNMAFMTAGVPITVKATWMGD